MRKIDVVQELGPGLSYEAAVAKIAEKLRLKEQGCWLTCVHEVLALTQHKENWTIKYRIGTGTITRPIRPELAHEILEADMVSRSLPDVWFIHNPTQIEDMVILE